MFSHAVTRIVSVAVTAIGAAALVLAFAGPSAAASGRALASPDLTGGDTYKLVQTVDGSNWCLDYKFNVDGCSQGDGYQKWTLQASTDGDWKLVNTEGGTRYCVDVTGPFKACSPGDGNQEISLVAATGGTYKVEIFASTDVFLCLDWYYLYYDIGPSFPGFNSCQQGNSEQRWTFQLST